MNTLLVAGGGAVGAALRYLIGGWVVSRLGPDFPWGTFIVNVSGCLLIGAVLGLVEHGALPGGARLFLAVGVLGGYTTFSTFGYETLRLLEGGELLAAASNAFGQLALGLVAVYLGLVAARILAGA
ncbi:fluoride efflux transporter CrcB [Rubrobacter aplysinae]|uniref:fluoride efflux transporter CrcB n=1 Tax=Rubrobacter aplysinae TaxID=909625 RepID=UPI00064BDD73|nr:fluoride efflux transporter CrcB [Rubrobacter aplysinae]